MTANSDSTEIFRQEAGELLEQLEAALLDLERAPDDRNLVNRAFRALHTIKGSGAMFGFEEVAAFAHEFESAFDRVRKGDAAPDPDLIAIALNAKDFLRTQIEKPDEARAVIGVCILSELRKLVQGPGGASAPAAAAEPTSVAPASRKRWRIAMRFHKDGLVNGSNPLLLIDKLRGLGDCRVVVHAEATLPLGELDPTACYFHWDAILETEHPRSEIEDVSIFVAPEMDLTIEEESMNSPLAPADRGVANPPSAASAPPATSGAGAQASAAEGPAKHDAKEAATIRVPAERLDEMMDRVGELVIAQARLTQLANSGASAKGVAEEIERLAASLRDAVMGVRMLPIGSLFGRFRRLVHDLSRDLGKEIELVAEGEETELDKTMIERLADPLVHVIRNAADHGLESPEARRAAGKDPVGRIRLVACHAGAEVLISVSDDGKGLDVKNIRAKAEELGLVAAGAVLSEAELYQLLFQPGFTTAQQVSALSGRGVGMDVVRRTIEGLRGSIDIASEPGKGSTFTLRLPLTLAIIEGLLVRVAETRYVVPLTAIEECVELSTDADARSKGRSFLNIRGELVPFLRLRELFAETGEPDPHQKVVIVANADARVGLVVDQIIGSHQIVIKSLSKLHADVPSFSGATILGDGAVALILDVPHLIGVGQAREARLQAANQEAA
jgi:two-component system chemotaxis sensor kinase CheA